MLQDWLRCTWQSFRRRLTGKSSYTNNHRHQISIQGVTGFRSRFTGNERLTTITQQSAGDHHQTNHRLPSLFWINKFFFFLQLLDMKCAYLPSTNRYIWTSLTSNFIFKNRSYIKNPQSQTDIKIYLFSSNFEGVIFLIWGCRWWFMINFWWFFVINCVNFLKRVM